MDEFQLIERYFAHSGAGNGVIVGVGDDGAVLEPTPGTHQVQVIDTLIEGVHYPEGMHPADVGYRSVAVNLSDLAAMAARPRWMTLALTLRDASDDWLAAFAEGLYAAAAEYDVALVGGDTTQGPATVISVHLSGEVEPDKALRRDSARPGDTIYVTGTLGDAAAGLDGLQHGRSDKELHSRFARPSARVRYGQQLAGFASAAIDLSDGFAADLQKLLHASGVGADIDLAALPISEVLGAQYSADRQRHFALYGGDDYELCFTAASAPPDPGVMRVTAVGRISETPGLRATLDGEIVPLDTSGYRHFA